MTGTAVSSRPLIRVSSVPGQPAAALPVHVRLLRQPCQPGQLLVVEVHDGRVQVGRELDGGGGPREDDPGPGLTQDEREGHGVTAQGGFRRYGLQGVRGVRLGEPAVGHALLDDHREAGVVGLGEGGGGRGLQGVVRRLDGTEERLAVDRHGEGRADRVRLGGAAGGEADRGALGGRLGEPRVEFLVGEGRAVRGHRVDLIQVQAVAEQFGGFAALAVVGLDTVVLDLVLLGVGGPVGGVGVAPFAADDHVVDTGVPGEPVREELLGAAVGAGHVEVADALEVGGVEEFVGAGAEGFHAAVGSEVFVSAEVDVARASDGGEAESDVAGGGGCCRQSGEGHRGLRSVGSGTAVRPTYPAVTFGDGTARPRARWVPACWRVRVRRGLSRPAAEPQINTAPRPYERFASAHLCCAARSAFTSASWTATALGAVPPLALREASAPGTLRTVRTSGVRWAEILANWSSVRSLSSLPSASAALTHSPATSWATRKGTPCLTSHSAMSVASEKPAGASSSMRSRLTVRVAIM